MLHRSKINEGKERLAGAGSQASKEANKGWQPTSAHPLYFTNAHYAEVAKDSHASVNTRATAAKDAVSDKIDQKKHETNADVHKNKADL